MRALSAGEGESGGDEECEDEFGAHETSNRPAADDGERDIADSLRGVRSAGELSDA
jgi:hypothetical protein